VEQKGHTIQRSAFNRNGISIRSKMVCVWRMKESADVRTHDDLRWTRRACLGFKPGVRDFRREAGTWNMVAVSTSKVQLEGFGTHGNTIEWIAGRRHINNYS